MTDLLASLQARRGRPWCLFVDRDGVINRRIVGGYVRSPQEFELLPGALDALRTLSRWAPSLVVLTNQQGVGKGLMSERDLALVHAHFLRMCEGAGVSIDAILHCPHLATDACDCRKPGIGLAMGWLRSHPDCLPALSVMVGDAETDMEMAARLAAETGGCLAIKVGDPSPLADLTYGSLMELTHDIDATTEETP